MAEGGRIERLWLITTPWVSNPVANHLAAPSEFDVFLALVNPPHDAVEQQIECSENTVGERDAASNFKDDHGRSISFGTGPNTSSRYSSIESHPAASNPIPLSFQRNKLFTASHDGIERLLVRCQRRFYGLTTRFFPEIIKSVLQFDHLNF